MNSGQGWRYAEFSLNGFKEFQAEVMALPMTLADQAQALVNDKVVEAAAELKSAYPRGPGNRKKGYTGGNLIKGVKYRTGRRSKGKTKAQAWVKSTAPHAWLYDHGSTKGERFYNGWSRGFMPGTFLFQRITMRHQLNLQQELADLMKAQGLGVRAA